MKTLTLGKDEAPNSTLKKIEMEIGEENDYEESTDERCYRDYPDYFDA